MLKIIISVSLFIAVSACANSSLQPKQVKPTAEDPSELVRYRDYREFHYQGRQDL